jgi:hypothetical protein
MILLFSLKQRLEKTVLGFETALDRPCLGHASQAVIVSETIRGVQ